MALPTRGGVGPSYSGVASWSFLLGTGAGPAHSGLELALPSGGCGRLLLLMHFLLGARVCPSSEKWKLGISSWELGVGPLFLGVGLALPPRDGSWLFPTRGKSRPFLLALH